jgi:ATP-dependent Clp protease protease subunit
MFRGVQRPKNAPEQAQPVPPPAQPFTPVDQHLFDARIVFVSGEVNGDLALRVNRQLLALEKVDPARPIVMWIDSPGGEMFSGYSIYDTARFIQPRVITLVAGFAASMASVIALAAEKRDRVAFPNAKLLIHQPLIHGVMQGSASELEIHAADIIATKKRLHRLYAERTGTPIDRFEALMERDHWLGPAAAQELGLISRVLESRSQLEALLKAQ